MAFLFLIVIVGAAAYKITSPEDRARYLVIARAAVQDVVRAARKRRPEYDAFQDALGARTQYALVTMALVGVNVAVVGFMLFGATSMSDPGTLVHWGASLGTRTTNGEWWRLVTASFVHLGLLHLLIDGAILWQLGAVLERLVGRLAFTAVYLSAGVFASLVNLSSHPIAVTVGAPGAIFGLYGLLIASLGWQLFRGYMDPEPEPDPELETDAANEEAAPRRLTIPLIAVKRIGICAAVFLAYSAFHGFVSDAEFMGLLVGFGYGLVVVWRAGDHAPAWRPVMAIVMPMLAAAVTLALPLRNIADVQPELARVIATEEGTAAKYQTANAAFQKGRVTADALARLAEQTIVPELQAMDQRLQSLKNVPPEHQPLIADAREYLRLRADSWHARAEALRRLNAPQRRAVQMVDGPTARLQAEARYRSNLAVMGRAEGAERAALAAFRKIKPPDSQPRSSAVGP